MEYVLAYNQGKIYCAFHEDFRDDFFQVAKRWRESLARVTQDKAFVIAEPEFEHVPEQTFELVAEDSLPPLGHNRSASNSAENRERASSHQSSQSLAVDIEPQAIINGQHQPHVQNGAPVEA